jgi:hypothetical protein
VDTSGSNALTGRVSQAALPAFLEFLAAARLSGVLRLEGPDEFTGSVVVSDGAVTHAACASTDGPLTGALALRDILGWAFVHLEFHDGASPDAPRSVHGSVGHLLLEASRLGDEARRDLDSRREYAVVRLRHNMSAYVAVSPGAMRVLRHVKAYRGRDVRVSTLRRELPGVPLDDLLLELHGHGLVDLEGLPRDTRASAGAQTAVLEAVVPVRRARTRPSAVAPEPNDLVGLVESLADGRRSAEDIRLALRIPPGRLRAALRALKAAGRVEYQESKRDSAV